MPRLSLYRPEKSNDYKFMDKTIKEQFTVGGTDLYIHKYLGANNPADSKDLTQPHYDSLDPTKIQDLLFLENRNRVYDKDIYRVRGHYNVANLDFDLSQFGLFLTNDVIFVTVHYNNMVEVVGRKLMVGDVFELPHLTDYHPLNEKLPVGLRRFYQITDANYASEGFSQTWYPHLWRIKCEPLINSQEFNDIMVEPIEKDNYMGDWDANKEYCVPEGQTYTITFGGKIYELTGGPGGTCVEPGVSPPAPPWKPSKEQNLIDVITDYNTNIDINQAVIDEAKRVVPKIGYDRSQLYIVPTMIDGEPAVPVNVVDDGSAFNSLSGQVVILRNPEYLNSSTVVRIRGGGIIPGHSISLQLGETAPERLDTGSGQVSGDIVLTAQDLGIAITGPYGTADNTYARADQFLRSIATMTDTPVMSRVITLVNPIDNNIAVDLLVRATVFSQNGTSQQVWPAGTRITAINTLTNSITVSNATQSAIVAGTPMEIAYDFVGTVGYQPVSRGITVTTSAAAVRGSTSIKVTGLSTDNSTVIVNKTITSPSEYFKVGTTVLAVDLISGTMTLSDGVIADVPPNISVVVEVSKTTTFMDYRADCDPRFQFIRRGTPRSFGYIFGYDSGNGEAPNGEPMESGISFPANPRIGDYFLRIDYLPQKLFRFSGTRWVEISENVRTEFGLDAESQSQRSRFINDVARTPTSNGLSVPTRQSLSDALRIKPD